MATAILDDRDLYGAYQDKLMAHAIIEIAGQQIRVEPSRFYDVNRLVGDVDSQLEIDRVLYVNNAGEVSIGAPVVEGATVQATILRHMRGRKVLVYKMKPKKKTRKKRGHRQELTRIMIDSITVGGTAIDTKDQPRG
ncbi:MULTISPECIES: 50S ribosomal protein L21 [Leptolyngbya]|nr:MULTISPECIES: 50S ribosomal protein L21 [Leptolyngbya]WNZ44927.1 50S ribosomal protein L21 [Leptolyngbya boryana CZ1]BAS57651.1 50S ribosomal protein L21 [Leptolyngbya boryana IAM M-101]BAS63999.1 50S ribosomal protein L21 [Leptolyngbya boryana dg5]